MSEEIKKVIIENTTKLVEIINANELSSGTIYNEKGIKNVYGEIYQFICNLVCEQGRDKE